MSRLYIAQKLFTLGERFTVTDAEQQPRYVVSGSFLQIPKTFTIADVDGMPVAQITKTVMSLLPRFTVTIGDQDVATIRKEFTVFRPKYSIDIPRLDVAGDGWDLTFVVSREGQEVAKVSRKLLSWADTYEVEVADETLEVLAVALVVAIDRVRADQGSASVAAT